MFPLKLTTSFRESKAPSNTTQFIIVVRDNISSIAHHLQSFLSRHYPTRIIYQLTDLDLHNNHPNDLYIILYNSRPDKKLPRNYIYYQIEQLGSEGFASPTMLQNAKMVWDFSTHNLATKAHYMPMPFYDAPSDNILHTDYHYDILFYGALNDRRKQILTALQQKYNLHVGFAFGEERDALIKSARIIINLHYYSNACIETARFNEILRYNKLIISESSEEADAYNRNLYADFVDFVDVIKDDLSNISVLCERIDTYLLDESNYNDKITYIKHHKHRLQKHSEYYVNKNLALLLHHKRPYEFEYPVSENTIYVVSTYTPATPLEPGIEYYPSSDNPHNAYMNIIYNAKRGDIPYVIITNNVSLSSQIDKHLEFLAQLPQWDVFVGSIAQIPPNTMLRNIYHYENRCYLEINKIPVTGFSIYSKTGYDKILESAIFPQPILVLCCIAPPCKI